jgi:hypothetical protein
MFSSLPRRCDKWGAGGEEFVEFEAEELDGKVK